LLFGLRADASVSNNTFRCPWIHFKNIVAYIRFWCDIAIFTDKSFMVVTTLLICPPMAISITTTTAKGVFRGYYDVIQFPRSD